MKKNKNIVITVDELTSMVDKDKSIIGVAQEELPIEE